MSDRERLLRHPFRWLLKAAGTGFILSALVGVMIYGPREAQILTFGGIGSLFCVVMWAGGVFLGPWMFQPSPRLSPTRFAIRAQLRWLLVYLVLLVGVTFLVRPLFGVNLAGQLRSFVFTAGTGYLIGGLILSFRLTALVAEKSRDLESAKARASFLALQAQLSPHTLFNGLNTVAALIPVAPDQAEAAVEGLSRILRKILEALERDAWTLGEEFGLLKDLLELEKSRFGNRLSWELSCPPERESRAMPPLLLLPLVENALKHGFRPKVGSCRLEVRAEVDRVVIQDDGVGWGPDPVEGVGLRTVRQRLEAMGGRLEQAEAGVGTRMEVVW